MRSVTASAIFPPSMLPRRTRRTVILEMTQRDEAGLRPAHSCLLPLSTVSQQVEER